MERAEMAGEHRSWRRQRESFWRAHHEAWKLSDLNQREYCEAHLLPQKGFENWRQKFKAEPQVPERKQLYRRGGLSHRLSHTLSHSVSHTLGRRRISLSDCSIESCIELPGKCAGR